MASSKQHLRRAFFITFTRCFPYKLLPRFCNAKCTPMDTILGSIHGLCFLAMCCKRLQSCYAVMLLQLLAITSVCVSMTVCLINYDYVIS